MPSLRLFPFLLLSSTFGSIAPALEFEVISSPIQQYTTGTTRFKLGAIPDWTSGISSIETPGQKLTFSNTPGMTKLSVPTSWTTWSQPPYSENSTPDVLYTGNNSLQWIRIDLQVPSNTFGFEVQGNEQTAFAHGFQIDFYSGSSFVGAIDRDIDSNGGARLIAATSSTTTFTHVYVSDYYSLGRGFALANFRFGPYIVVPEPSSWVFATIATVAFGMVRHLRRWQETAGRPRS